MASPEFAIEIPFKIKENYPDILKKYWGSATKNPVKWFEKAQEEAKKVGAKYVGFYLNIDDLSETEDCIEVVKKIGAVSNMPLIIRGCSNKTFNKVLIPALASHLPENCVVAHAQDTNYEEVVHATLGHTLVLRTPIDINLTKELNILSIDEGLMPEKILIDPDMGCVGYGLDYGYSIIERIKEAALAGDKMLDMPIIVFAGEESHKAKESKSPDFKESWGELQTRSEAWEVSTVSALLAAGADIAVVWNPKTVETVKKNWGEE